MRWGPVLEGQPGISVGCDNLQGGYDVTRHLLGAGAQAIAFLGTATSHYPEFFDRYRGYERALMEVRVAHLLGLQVDAITTEESGFQAARELLCARRRIRRHRRRQRPHRHRRVARVAGVGHRRAAAGGAWSGFDDIPAASLTNPPLTTVMQDTRRAGELLVETLLRQIAGDPAATA